MIVFVFGFLINLNNVLEMNPVDGGKECAVYYSAGAFSDHAVIHHPCEEVYKQIKAQLK